MKKNDAWKDAFKDIEDNAPPTEEQKERMLRFVLANDLREDSGKVYRWISHYPWRFAFGVAAVQTALCTLIFGNNYIHLFLRFFGG